MHDHYTNHIHIVPKLNAQDDPMVQSLVRLIETIAKDANKQVVDKDNLKDGTLVIAVGGDGTMIEAMHRAVQCEGYALGINLGHIGFLTDISVKENPATIYHTLKNVIQDLAGLTLDNTEHISFEDRYVLETSKFGGLAVNDVSISSLASDEMVKYQLFIDEHNAGVHRANSLLVSTATGSTAYSLSAGGALLMPDMQSIQVVPVAASTLTSRPLIISGKSTVTVKVFGPGVSVRMDGQRVFSSEEVYTEQNPFVLEVWRHSKPAVVIHPKDWNFFDVLTNKLGWIHE